MSTLLTSSTVTLKLAMRRLWADHVIWTRAYIIAVDAGTPDAEVASGRLLRNQEDIGNAFDPYYGDAAGEKLADLLKQHIMIAEDLTAAAKSDDDVKFNECDHKWIANADDIATFLSGINHNWTKKDLVDLFNLHMKLTKEEVVDRLTKDWNADVKKFDEIFSEAMVMADALTEGIVKQFPFKF
jgi:hypothetical protein